MRSSACAEDSEAASFAGQQETYLDVEGADEVCAKVVDCWASFFSERALFYRSHKGSLDDLAMAVVVQRMVDADKAGVLFTVDPVQRRRDQMIVEAVCGLGEQVVSGEVTPDHYVVDRAGAVKRERLAERRRPRPRRSCASWPRSAGALEEHFGGPQDVEWAIAGGSVYLLQSRPGDDAVSRLLDSAGRVDRALLERRAPRGARAHWLLVLDARRPERRSARGAHARHGAPLSRAGR